MSHLLQVGTGSGGMPVLDLVCRDRRITQVTIIEPDVYKPHNIERHLFPLSGIGEFKAILAERWLTDRRPDLKVDLIINDVLDPDCWEKIDKAARDADVAVCAADNEPVKYHWDALMRRHRKHWTLGEVLSGGIGGFVHWFRPDGPCYGCVASYLQRSIAVEKEKTPDYSQVDGLVAETTIPASRASIHAIASLHALVTLEVLEKGEEYAPGFTSLLLTLQRVPEVFDEAFRPFRFRIPRAPDCLFCQPEAVPSPLGDTSSEALDVALDKALARLGDG